MGESRRWVSQEGLPFEMSPPKRVAQWRELTIRLPHYFQFMLCILLEYIYVLTVERP